MLNSGNANDDAATQAENDSDRLDREIKQITIILAISLPLACSLLLFICYIAYVALKGN